MKKTVIVFILAVHAALMYAQTSVSLDKTLDDAVVYFNAHIPRATRIAIPYINGGSAGLSGYLADKLTARLVYDSGIIVVERDKERIQAVADEMDYQLSGNVNDETMLSIGKKLGAQVMITGALSKQGRQYRLELRAVDVESGRILASRITENIRGDDSWVTLPQPRIGLAFEGGALTDRNKQTLYQGVRRAAQKYGVSLEPPSSAAAAEKEEGALRFIITFEAENRFSNYTDGLFVGEITVGLERDGVMIQESKRHSISEATERMLFQRATDAVENDRLFFQALAIAAR
ncbi:MAG: CsgG/HfaB family protein [Treponema sp.]|jgi:TolB-like protein|nr:CsgG/HfaB family protein [Treponema sp.]